MTFIIVCFIICFVVNPWWSWGMTKEFIAYVRSNWAYFRNNKKED